jgi:Na+/H+ antiporter NhaD/arsenite permease-like protein
VASNLGGFSTRWGDTPNIIEAHTWGLGASAFATQILPINLVLLSMLSVSVYVVTRIRMRSILVPPGGGAALRVSHAMVQFRSRKQNVHVNRRLALVGSTGLAIAIAGTTLLSQYEIAASVTAILFCVAWDYSDSSSHIHCRGCCRQPDCRDRRHTGTDAS